MEMKESLRTAAPGRSGDADDSGILSELAHSALFGSVLDRQEVLKWAWAESKDPGQEGSLIEYLMSQGRILERDGLLTVAGMQHLFDQSAFKHAAAKERLEFGAAFLTRLAACCPDLLVSGVSGSASYGSSGKDDDIDILMITRKGALWKVLLRALLEARKLRRSMPGMPIICLSYCMEEDAFAVELARHRSRLFARDFLRLMTVTGKAGYRKMLAGSEWMRDFYPFAFDSRMEEICEEDAEQCRARFQALSCLLFIALGAYLKMAAEVRNWRFRRRGAGHMLFRAVLAPDRCVYESVKWKGLERSLEDGKSIN